MDGNGNSCSPLFLRQVKEYLFIFLTNYQRLRTHRDETISAWSFLKLNISSWRTTWTRARRRGSPSAGCPDARAQLIVGRSGAARGFPQKLQLDRRRQTSDLKISPLLLCPLSFFAPALFFSFQHFLVIDFPIQSQDFSWLFGASDPSIFVFVVDPTIYPICAVFASSDPIKRSCMILVAPLLLWPLPLSCRSRQTSAYPRLQWP